MLPAVSYNGEYDWAFGPAREVRAYDALRHEWVVCRACPIVLSGPDPADEDEDDGDDAIFPRRPLQGWEKTKRILDERRQWLYAELIDHMREHGKPMTGREIVTHLDVARSWWTNNSAKIDEIVPVADGIDGKLWGVRGETYHVRDLMSRTTWLMFEALRKEWATMIELCDRLGMHKGIVGVTLRRYDGKFWHVVQHMDNKRKTKIWGLLDKYQRNDMFVAGEGE